MGSIKFQWRLKFNETSLFSKRCLNLVDKVFVNGVKKRNIAHGKFFLEVLLSGVVSQEIQRVFP